MRTSSIPSMEILNTSQICRISSEGGLTDQEGNEYSVHFRQEETRYDPKL